MTKIPPDDILEGLYKLRIRESEKLKTVLELCDLERLKTMVKRGIKQEIRNNNFGIRNGNFEKMVKNQGTKQRVQRILGYRWQWETNGQCEMRQLQFPPRYQYAWKSYIKSVSNSMTENHREPEVPEKEVPAVECLDGLAIASKELATTHFVKSGTLQNACSAVVVELGKSAHTHIVRLMNNRQKGPKRIVTKAVAKMKKDDWCERGPVTDQCHDNEDLFNVDHLMHKKLGCAFQDMTPTKSNLWKSTDLTSVAPTLQNLRIGLQRNRVPSGRGSVEAGQKCVEIKGA